MPAKAPSTCSVMDSIPVLSIAPDGAAPAAGGRDRAHGALGPEVRSLREVGEQAVALAEERAIRRALASAGGNKSLAARLLRTNYTTIHAKMRRFGISAGEFGGPLTP